MNHYHDTIPAPPQLRLEFERKAVKQDCKILEFFKVHPFRDFTPPEVHKAIGYPGPVSSVRRAITNLTKEGWLQKTGNLRPGEFYASNNCWKYNG